MPTPVGLPTLFAARPVQLHECVDEARRISPKALASGREVE